VGDPVSDAGPRGVQGRRGEQGTQGVSGEQGVAGGQGVPGEAGVEGPQGAPGGLPRNITLSFWSVVAVAFVIIAVLSYVIAENRKLAREGAEAHDALCVFKADLGRRLEAGKAFLADHPGGFAGIDPTVLQTSINNQQATIDALASLDCMPPPDPPA
jgi:hypothetical protein